MMKDLSTTLLGLKIYKRDRWSCNNSGPRLEQSGLLTQQVRLDIQPSFIANNYVFYTYIYFIPIDHSSQNTRSRRIRTWSICFFINDRTHQFCSNMVCPFRVFQNFCLLWLLVSTLIELEPIGWEIN